MAVVAGYARRISGEADRQHSLALDRLGRLADANALLFSLHRVTQTLPASLDLDDVLDTTIGRLRGLFDFDSAAILALDDTDGTWQVIRRENVRLPPKMTTEDLPPPIRAAVVGRDRRAAPPTLAEQGGPGLSPKAGSGLYAVLAARGAIIGVLAVEHQSNATSPAATSSCSRASSSPSPWPSTTPAGSAGCAPSGPTRSAPASPATCTTASASRWPTWPSSSTAS